MNDVLVDCRRNHRAHSPGGVSGVYPRLALVGPMNPLKGSNSGDSSVLATFFQAGIPTAVLVNGCTILLKHSGKDNRKTSVMSWTVTVSKRGLKSGKSREEGRVLAF